MYILLRQLLADSRNSAVNHEVKASCSQTLLESSKCLCNHAKNKADFPSVAACSYCSSSPTTDQYLHALNRDNCEQSFCPGLSEVSKHLAELKVRLETLP